MKHSREHRTKPRRTPTTNWEHRYEIKKEFKLKNNLSLVHYYDKVHNDTDPFTTVDGSQLIAAKYICMGQWVVMQFRICSVTSTGQFHFPPSTIITGTCIASGIAVSIMALNTTNLRVIPNKRAHRYQVFHSIWGCTQK